jgi:lipid II:glycine glycyltransferase (peptidoglycan interpeptide bridge formation enzyme)
VRRAVRKAQGLKLEVEMADTLAAVRAFYRLHVGTRKRHGVPPQSFAFFENIHRHIVAHGQGMVVLARRSGAVIAGAMFFHLGRKAIYKFGASDERFQECRGNNLVMWEAIRWYAGHGYRTLHFGRTSRDNEGLRRFKSSWGCRESVLEYVKYDCRRQQFVTDADRSSGWHTRFVRLLPNPLLRAVGAWMYRHVA